MSAELFHAVASAGMIALAWTILLGLYLLIVVWAERRIAGLIRTVPDRTGSGLTASSRRWPTCPKCS